MANTPTLLHLRAEVKPLEKRVALTPENAKRLIAAGYKIDVERSSERIFDDNEYIEAGCQLVPTGSWKTADTSAFIFGLKELPEEDTPLKHRHIYFAHCFKQQIGWESMMRRFRDGGGSILDLEFLVDDHGRRVAAFGRAAGLAGAAAGIQVWCHRQQQPNGAVPELLPSPTISALAEKVSHQLNSVKEKANRSPRAMIFGAKGRCGKGAVEFLKLVGITDIAEWDMEETAKGGPFPEILSYDLFVNCVYLMGPIAPFITRDMIQSADKALSVIVDVSCDYTNPHNPLPVYNTGTSFTSPSVLVDGGVDVVAIDHLPTLIPRESSEDFSNDLMPSLLQLKDWANSVEAPLVPVWARANTVFQDKLQELSKYEATTEKSGSNA